MSLRSRTAPTPASIGVTLFAFALLLTIYGTYRQRYIWGSDSFGYFELGRLFSQGRATLPTPFPAAEFPAVVPPGFSLNARGEVVPNYTPGLPLLMVAGHLVRAPMFVTPFLGALSTLLLHLLLRGRVSGAGAILFPAAWAFMPLTVYGSTMLMSDGVSATVLLAALLAYRRAAPVATAWLLGLAIAIRPTNALFLAPFLLVLRWERRDLRLAGHFALPCALYGLYNWRLFGAPWRTGYGDVASLLSPEIFPAHFAFYVTAVVQVICPAIAALAVAGLATGAGWRHHSEPDVVPVAPWREKAFYLSWPVLLMIFYGFWPGGGIDRWWWARFILPGLPLLFLLAAHGFENVRGWLANGTPNRARQLATVALFATVAAVPLYAWRFGVRQRDVWNRSTGSVNFDLIRRVESHAPPGSLVGTIDHASTCLLYTSLVPFAPTHEEAPRLVAAALERGRRVFLLVEPWDIDHKIVRQILATYRAEELDRFSIWGGLPLFELTPRP